MKRKSLFLLLLMLCIGIQAQKIKVDTQDKFTGIDVKRTSFEKIVSEIQTLSQKLDNLVIVTNNVFEDGVIYDAGTMEYLRALGRINAALAHLADRVAEVVVGIPVELKG